MLYPPGGAFLCLKELSVKTKKAKRDAKKLKEQRHQEMLETQKATSRKKHEDSIKFLYFSRYLMIRYFATAMFFANMFWLIFCIPYQATAGITVAAVLTIWMAIVMLELISKLHNREADIPKTRIYFWVQIAINLLLAVILFTPIKGAFFPFVTDQTTAYLILGILLIGVILSIIIEIRIHNILIGRDRYLRTIKAFQKHAPKD